MAEYPGCVSAQLGQLYISYDPLLGDDGHEDSHIPQPAEPKTFCSALDA